MDLENLDKFVHLTKVPNGIEVMFAGQPCLTVTQIGEGYVWRANPLFAKISYGANIFEDVPFSFETHDSAEMAIADGLAKLNELNAFYGIVTLPVDTNATVNESVETKIEDNVGLIADSIMFDCMEQSLLMCDNLFEANQLANDLYDMFFEELKDKSELTTTYGKDGSVVNTAKGKNGKSALYKQIAASLKRPKKNQWQVKESTENLEEAKGPIKDSDAFWKSWDERKKKEELEARQKELGIKPEEKRKQGRQSDTTLDDIIGKARENVGNGKKPVEGFPRKDKVRFMRANLHLHPEFAEHHVSKAGRPVGTTKTAKAEKEAETKKATTVGWGGWGGLGAR